MILLFWLHYCVLQRLLQNSYLCLGSDVDSSRTGGSFGESGLRRCDHYKQTQSPECSKPQHDPTDLPSAAGTCTAQLVQTSVGQMSRSGMCRAPFITAVCY